MLLAGETPCTPAATKAGMQCSVLPLAEQRSQLAVWAMASAPLLLSADLTAVPNESMAILTNRDVLAINQDPLGRMSFRFISDTVHGVDAWKKELVGGDVAVAIVNMNTTDRARQMASPDVKAAEWVAVPNHLIYDDATCPDLGQVTGCSHVGAEQLVQCCEMACLYDAACDAFNINPETPRCNKRGCSPDNITKASWNNGDAWSAYRMVLPRPPAPPAPPAGPPLPAGYVLQLSDLGFAQDTRVHVKDVFAGQDLGIHTGTFVTTNPIGYHDVLLLRLSYSPFRVPTDL